MTAADRADARHAEGPRQGPWDEAWGHSAAEAGRRMGEVLAPKSGLLADADPVLFGSAMGKAATAALRSPGQVAGAFGRWGARLLTGVNEVGLATIGRSRPASPDRRFADLAWQANPWFVGWHRAWSATTQLLVELVEAAKLDGLERMKAEFAVRGHRGRPRADQLPAGNPAALQRAFETGGLSVLRRPAQHGRATWPQRRPPAQGRHVGRSRWARTSRRRRGRSSTATSSWSSSSTPRRPTRPTRCRCCSARPGSTSTT